ncbi:Pr6Pr family membrane protein [Micromonospora sp. WMMA1363]|uniref:Pr6Pr family membrane protein n=1 Tax=Micromonospora sp. WMMA1363 TaxID=3053985 RepID=UPI00259CB831|nr:Pr6Pr family membrane protein [Micromonospora sp. WMMA1363]MDM4718271.1 Pr6Pr family membrane protein [Micromonospora sp. WMMA1363]
MTLYITITAVVYHLVLANPASPFAMPQADRAFGEVLGNQFLHTVVPLLAVTDWALFDRRGRLRPRYAVWWLAFPLGYLGFALVRGLIVEEYPYPFVDAGALGYRGVGISAVAFAVAFWLLGLGLVGVDRGLARWRPPTTTPSGTSAAAEGPAATAGPEPAGTVASRSTQPGPVTVDTGGPVPAVGVGVAPPAGDVQQLDPPETLR